MSRIKTSTKRLIIQSLENPKEVSDNALISQKHMYCPGVSSHIYPLLGTFFGLTPRLGVKRYSYHSWPLGQLAPAVPSTAGCILAGQKKFGS